MASAWSMEVSSYSWLMAHYSPSPPPSGFLQSERTGKRFLRSAVWASRAAEGDRVSARTPFRRPRWPVPAHHGGLLHLHSLHLHPPQRYHLQGEKGGEDTPPSPPSLLLLPSPSLPLFLRVKNSLLYIIMRDTHLLLRSLLLSQFEETVVFFGEDTTDTSTDEFFGIFSTFLQSLSVSLEWCDVKCFAWNIYGGDDVMLNSLLRTPT